MSLPIGEHIEWLLLGCVHDGHVTMEVGGLYFEDGHRVRFRANTGFQALCECDYVQLGEMQPDRSYPVRLTDRGLDWYEELCKRERAETVVYGPGPQFASSSPGSWRARVAHD